MLGCTGWILVMLFDARPKSTWSPFMLGIKILSLSSRSISLHSALRLSTKYTSPEAGGFLLDSVNREGTLKAGGSEKEVGVQGKKLPSPSLLTVPKFPQQWPFSPQQPQFLASGSFWHPQDSLMTLENPTVDKVCSSSELFRAPPLSS